MFSAKPISLTLSSPGRAVEVKRELGLSSPLEDRKGNYRNWPGMPGQQFVPVCVLKYSQWPCDLV